MAPDPKANADLQPLPPGAEAPPSSTSSALQDDPNVIAIRAFAYAQTRSPLYDCGHADAWSGVARAETVDDLLCALAYCRGYADCARLACEWLSPSWQIASTLAQAAVTFATVLRRTIIVDAERVADTYRRELVEWLRLTRP
jgi:hypothetical protein